jgi:hypothetical protein
MTPKDKKVFARAGEISERGVRTGRHLQAEAFRDMWMATWQAVSRLAALTMELFEQKKYRHKQ